MALRLATRKGERILASLDASLFHAGKGPNLDGDPFGIVPSKYANPFRVTFSGKVATMAPGILSVYGRQIELDEPLQVADFSPGIEADIAYCTVYVEVAITDSVYQEAYIKLDTRGANYRNFASSGERGNLHGGAYGRYQAAIARFTYQPIGTGLFSLVEYPMPTFDPESRYASDTVTDSINGSSISNLADKESSTVLRWKKAVHADTATYGKSFGGVTIDEDLSGLYTVKRVVLQNLLDLQVLINDGTYLSGSSSVSVDADHLAAVRIYLDGGTQGAIPTCVANWTRRNGSTLSCSLGSHEEETWLYGSGSARSYLEARWEYRDPYNGFLIFGRELSDISTVSYHRDYVRFDFALESGQLTTSWTYSGPDATTAMSALYFSGTSARLMADFIYQGDVSLT